MRGHVEKGPGEDFFYLVIELGKNAKGGRVRRRQTFFGGRRAADAELVRLLQEMENGPVDPGKLTVAELLDRWLLAAKSSVSAKTAERYGELCELYLKPELGSLRLTKLRPLHVQDFLAGPAKKRHDKKEGELSPRTVLAQYRVLKQALNQAVKWQIIVTNPAAAVAPPRPQHVEMKALDEAQTATLLAAAAGTRLYLPILLAVSTGLRRGEILALRWQDVDLDTGIVRVRQSLQQVKDGVSFKSPKTQKSRRSIPLPSITVEALKRHKTEQKADRLAFGPGYKDQGLVLPRSDGQAWRPNALTCAFAVLVRKTQLPEVRFHDLRHSHASQLLKQGTHPKIVSERLGHSTIGITLDIYSHLLPGLQEQAVDKIDAALRSAIEGHATKAAGESGTKRAQDA